MSNKRRTLDHYPLSIDETYALFDRIRKLEAALNEIEKMCPFNHNEPIVRSVKTVAHKAKEVVP